MSREEPLLAPRQSSEHSSIRNEDEEDALLTGERTHRSQDGSRRDWSFWRQLGLFVWSLVATMAVVILAVMYQHRVTTQQPGPDDLSWGPGPGGKPEGKRNIVFMVSDGMGPTSLSLTRSFRQLELGLPANDTLVLDRHHIGTSRTRSSSSLVTDSAAGATAFSCGHKSYNGAISVLPNHTACGTVLEAAHLAGYKTGLVVTTRITDATPACFASHANRREYEDLIAEQEIGEHPLGRVVDLILGGGRCHFLPAEVEGGCRADDRDLTKVAQDKGFHYISDRNGFDGLNVGQNAKLPLLGLFAERDIPYEIDRRFQEDTYPSLEEMSRTALAALKKATESSEHGFFLMIEGSRIDHAGHGNDPAAQVHEVLAYDKAFAAVLDFIEKEDTPTVLVATSDHETGGLAVARQLHKSYPEYKWLPDVLAKASHSSEYLGRKLNEYLSSSSKKDTLEKQRDYVRKSLLKEGLGIEDATDEEVGSLLQPDNEVPSSYLFADIISRRAQVGWTTHGHSGVDVNIYASSTKDAWPLHGNHENTEVGDFLAAYLDLDVEAVTQKLQEQASLSWLGDPLGADIRVNQLDSYHGDFRKRGEGCDCGQH
ncbi:alkaline phosphatase Pho8 [Talaromyces stipitatus ATCC 10500]|uniref:Alkaline phosphatase n=1 Tax=Talaromyces stipitatus (strain ATCC 10500 / CBS 375.48 / QM 6759 / NRRL 1006) TaxID=441959 RepID=B8MEF2_TALSN|nr:alkaline phosphatase Pho8 [Talaromyces stipitatus ATCC 10500]EED16579.1 alkaline phosphatase Pho8 [Talaromyces stipitatus ATCC 10500]